MQINLEQPDSHSIQAYSDDTLKINDNWYTQNIVVNKESIIPDWTSKSIQDIQITDIDAILALEPEIIIFGHNSRDAFPSNTLVAEVAKQRIGLESMSIAAACRTYNVLLGENRKVVLAIIW